MSTLYNKLIKLFLSFFLFLLSDFDSKHELKTGSICPGENTIACVDSEELDHMYYTNNGDATEFAWLVILGYSFGDEGDFSLEWSLDYSNKRQALFVFFSLENIFSQMMLWRAWHYSR